MRQFIFFSAFMLHLNINAQETYRGYIYNYENKEKDPFKYKISVKQESDAYKTIYTIYSLSTGKLRYTVTASHFKNDKKLVIEVEDEQYLLSVMNNREEITYDEPSLKIFGRRGNMAVLDKLVPNQLALQFINDQFQYVKVLSFLGSYSDGIFQFFIFDRNDKVFVPKTKSSVSFKDSTKTENWFIGTKKFCDGLNTWYYTVTINKDSVTLKSFPAKLNDYYKDKNKPHEIIKGVIKDNKIITNDPEYLINRFKFHNGILYQLNTEGEYDEYHECK